MSREIIGAFHSFVYEVLLYSLCIQWLRYRVEHYSEGGLFLQEGENVCLKGDYQELKILLKNHVVESFCGDGS